MNFLHWLTLLFICLRLTGQIDWSWWLVLLPIAFLLVWGSLIGLCGALAGLGEGTRAGKSR